MIESLQGVIAKIQEIRAEGREYRILVNSIDDWRTLCLKYGRSPDVEQRKGDPRIAYFDGIPVMVSAVVCPPGQVAMLVGAIGAFNWPVHFEIVR